MVGRIVLGALALGALAFVVNLLPDVARYAKLQAM